MFYRRIIFLSFFFFTFASRTSVEAGICNLFSRLRPVFSLLPDQGLAENQKISLAFDWNSFLSRELDLLSRSKLKSRQRHGDRMTPEEFALSFHSFMNRQELEIFLETYPDLSISGKEQVLWQWRIWKNLKRRLEEEFARASTQQRFIFSPVTFVREKRDRRGRVIGQMTVREDFIAVRPLTLREWLQYRRSWSAPDPRLLLPQGPPIITVLQSEQDLSTGTWN